MGHGIANGDELSGAKKRKRQQFISSSQTHYEHELGADNGDELNDENAMLNDRKHLKLLNEDSSLLVSRRKSKGGLGYYQSNLEDNEGRDMLSEDENEEASSHGNVRARQARSDRLCNGANDEDMEVGQINNGALRDGEIECGEMRGDGEESRAYNGEDEEDGEDEELNDDEMNEDEMELSESKGKAGLLRQAKDQLMRQQQQQQQQQYGKQLNGHRFHGDFGLGEGQNALIASTLANLAALSASSRDR